MIYIILSILLLLFLFVIFRKAMEGFRNPERINQDTPADHGIEFGELEIPAKNDKNLYGWFIPDRPQAPTLVLVHGWGRNVGKVLPYIEALHHTGFNLLAFDARHHGKSDRDEFSTMKKFAEDIISVLDYLDRTDKVKNRNYGIIGLSIGGGAAIYAAALDPRIKRVAAVGALASPMDIMKKQLSDHYIPYFPLGFLILTYLQRKIRLRFNDIAPERFIGKAKARFLLIHGEQDLTIPVSHAERLLQASVNGNTELWRISGRGHSDCHLEAGFWTRIITFFNTLEQDSHPLL